MPTNFVISGCDYKISVSDYKITTTDYIITDADYRIGRHLKKNYSGQKGFSFHRNKKLLLFWYNALNFCVPLSSLFI